MALVTEKQQQEVAELITTLERDTDAELVVVLAKRSDNYAYIPLLWAALLALLTPLFILLLPLWLTTFEVAVVQLVVCILLSLLFRIPVIAIHLIPKAVRYGRASNMARRQFLENNLHHTHREIGVLLFISEAEHYVEIIADRGINNLVEQHEWQTLVDNFVQSVKAGETHSGLITCIKACCEILREKVPATHEKNELPDRLVVL